MKKTTKCFKREASYTIELSLLMPVIIGCITLVIFMSFYLHDACLLSRYGFLAAHEIEQEGIINSERILYERLDRDFKTKSLGCWNVNSSVTEDNEKITVLLNGTMFSNGGMINLLINGNLFSINASCSVYKINEYKYIRSSSG